MKPENKALLDANRHHHETLTKAFYLRGLNGHEREGMQRVMSEEFQPGYTTDLWCPPCVSEMVLRLYRCYDEWLAKQPIEIPSNKDNTAIFYEEASTTTDEQSSQLDNDVEKGKESGVPAILPPDVVDEFVEIPSVDPPKETEEPPNEPEEPAVMVQVAASFPAHTEHTQAKPPINNHNQSRKQHRRR